MTNDEYINSLISEVARLTIELELAKKKLKECEKTCDKSKV
jgi:hypothetical protein